MAESSGGIRKAFTIEEELGRGTSGKVYKARMKADPNKVVAIKFISKKSLSTAAKDNLINEISALKKLKNRFIVNMMDFTWDDQFIYIIMDYCNQGDLSTYIKRRKALKEGLARIFCQQLCSALLFMRKNNMSHLDLKPSNLLLHASTPGGTPSLKVADFGFAHCLEDRSSELGLRGSPLYMAPEIILSKDYDSKVDIWSTGVILYEAIYGKAPYSSSSLEELLAKIKEDRPIALPRDRNISKECRHFLSRCLERNPESRMGWEELSMHTFLDLEFSIPHEKSTEKLSEVLRIATDADKRIDRELAVEFYEKAVKYLRSLVYYTDDESTRRKLQTKLNTYRRRLSEIQSNGSCDTSSINLHQNKHRELLELSRLTPGMRDGVEICLAARNYQQEGDLNHAIERYTSGLGVLMPLLKTEPHGKRRELLHQAVMLWMQQAESIKSRLEAKDSAQQQHPEPAEEVSESGESSMQGDGKRCSIQ